MPVVAIHVSKISPVRAEIPEGDAVNEMVSPPAGPALPTYCPYCTLLLWPTAEAALVGVSLAMGAVAPEPPSPLPHAVRSRVAATVANAAIGR